MNKTSVSAVKLSRTCWQLVDEKLRDIGTVDSWLQQLWMCSIYRCIVDARILL